MKYAENGDASYVTFRRFMERPEDQYPTYTFCFADNPNFVFSDAVNELKISRDDYSSLLKGVVANSNDTYDNLKTAVDNTDERFTKKFEDVILGIEFKTNNPTTSFSMDHQNLSLRDSGIQDIPLYVSHQDPDRVCFTRRQESGFGQDFQRIHDRIEFDPTELKGVRFQLYVHHPSQFTRSMQTPAFEKKDDIARSEIHLSANVAYVGVLRKRPGSNKPCNPELKDDDNEFKMRIISLVGCVPPYWRFLIMKNSSAELCRTRRQLEQTFQYIRNPAEIFKLYVPPCEEMQNPVNVREAQSSGRKQTRLDFTIRYTTQIYQEVQNHRDYNLDTLWSSVGGFVGIFMGYSLLQLPELLQVDWKGKWRMMFRRRKGKLACNLRSTV